MPKLKRKKLHKEKIKAMGPKTISDLVYGDHAKLWPGISEDATKANIETLKYLYRLSANLHFSVDHWDVTQMFSEGRIFITEKSRLNQIFYEQYEKEKKDYHAQLAPVIERARTQIKALYPGVVAEHLRQMEGREARVIEHIASYQTAINGEFKKLRDYQIAKDRIKGWETDIAGPIIKVIEECTFWKFRSVYKNEIRFITGGPIVLTEKNPAAGIDHVVDMGSFLAIYDVITSKLRVLEAENNISVNGNYHPHVSSSGEVCWGDLHQKSIEWNKNGDLFGLFNGLAAILSHYNPGNPFQALYHFKQAREKEIRKRLNPEEEPPTAEQVPAILNTPDMRRRWRGLETRVARIEGDWTAIGETLQQPPQVQQQQIGPYTYYVSEEPAQQPGGLEAWLPNPQELQNQQQAQYQGLSYAYAQEGPAQQRQQAAQQGPTTGNANTGIQVDVSR